MVGMSHVERLDPPRSLIRQVTEVWSRKGHRSSRKWQKPLRDHQTVNQSPATTHTRPKSRVVDEPHAQMASPNVRSIVANADNEYERPVDVLMLVGTGGS